MSEARAIVILCSLLPLSLVGCVASNTTVLPSEGMVLPRRGGEITANVSTSGSLFGPFSSLNKNCSVRANARVKVLRPPANGKIKIKQGVGNPAFAADSPFAACNGKRIGGTMVDYTPRSGFSGPDTFQFEIIFADGERRVLSPTLTVVP